METIKYNPETGRLQKACSKDEARFNLLGVRYTCKAVVATNGHFLAARPKQAGEPENCTVRYEKLGKNACELSRIEDNVLHARYTDGSTVAVIEKDCGDFPRWEQVVPSGDPQFEICLDANVLRSAIEVLGDSKCEGALWLKLQFFGAKAPVVIGAQESASIAVIMPLDDHKGVILDPTEALRQLM